MHRGHYILPFAVPPSPPVDLSCIFADDINDQGIQVNSKKFLASMLPRDVRPAAVRTGQYDPQIRGFSFGLLHLDSVPFSWSLDERGMGGGSAGMDKGFGFRWRIVFAHGEPGGRRFQLLGFEVKDDADSQETFVFTEIGPRKKPALLVWISDLLLNRWQRTRTTLEEATETIVVGESNTLSD